MHASRYYGEQRRDAALSSGDILEPSFEDIGDNIAAEGDPEASDTSAMNSFLQPTTFSHLQAGNPLSRGMPLLPDHGQDAFELLGHYLARTANSMGNGSTDANPFVVQLIPLAFSNDLILQLILTQSAVHRAVSKDIQTDTVANGYYGRSLQLFRKNVNDYIGGMEASRLTLAIGALIMCFTEVLTTSHPDFLKSIPNLA